jgi:hypothetical protein
MLAERAPAPMTYERGIASSADGSSGVASQIASERSP